jgi:hypothetical protein
MQIKRFFGSGAALCAVLAAAALLALTGCSGSNNETTTPTLVSITAATTKAAYSVGQDLDLSSITVTGTYSDGSTKAVPITGTNIAGYDKTQTGEQTVTVTVEGKTATFTVTVSAAAAPGNAQAPVISVQPQSGTYDIGAAVTLSVTAASPDGGTLSYQWHSAVSGGSWAAIEGATEASYTPSTAAEGAVSYYVRITNTNNGVSGTKTASVNSGTVTVTVSPGNIQAPNITVQPQGATYTVGDTATVLSVTAASPDGGTLSYQWHSAVSGGSWAAIEGATGASYTPSTAAEGTVSYYVRVINTNASGTKSAGANSDTVTVTVSPDLTGTPGSGVFAFTAWVNDDDSLVSDMPDYFDISRGLGERLVLTAAAGLTEIQWSMNGIDLPAPRGTAQSFTLEAVAYPVGDYTLGLYAEQGAIPYSINFTVTVDN